MGRRFDGASIVLGFVCMLPSFAPVRAQDAAALDPATLVRNLGSPDFAQRREATRKLRELGAAALPHLEKGLASDDLNVRLRCRDLLREARRSEPEKRLDAFVQRGEGPPPPGWNAFARTMGGKDLAMRRRFAEVVRVEANLAETLEKNPAAANDLIRDRCRKLQADPKATPERSTGLTLALVYAARRAPRLEEDAFRHLYGICHRPEVSTLIVGDPLLQDAMTEVLRGQRADRNTFSLRLSLARVLGLGEYLAKDVPAEVDAQIDGALKAPNDLNRLAQVVYLSRQVGSLPRFQERLEPAVRRQAEVLAKSPADLNRLLQLTNLARTLDMKETMKEVLRPHLLKAVGNKATPNTLHQIVSAARQLDAFEEVRGRLRGWLEDRVHGAFDKSDLQVLFQVRNEVQQLDEEALFGPFLAQAARRIVEKQFLEAGNVHALQQAHNLATQFALEKILEETLPPLLLRQVERLGKEAAPKLPELQILVYLAEQSPDREKVLRMLHPTMVRTLRSLKDQPLTPDLSARALVLARTLDLPDGIPLAARIAVEDRLPVYTRVQAIQYIGQKGKAADRTRLEPLLGDTTSLGSMSHNGVRLATQMRDVALAALVHLDGKKLADFGFLYPKQTGLDFPRIPFQGFGFRSNAERDQALTRWRSEEAK